MNDRLATFEFEKDFADNLRCIPMAVRFKLDIAGIKLSLRQWSGFERMERRWLLEQPCETPAEVKAYRDRLTDVIRNRTGEAARQIGLDEEVAWSIVTEVPPVVRAQATSKGVAPPSADHWKGLTNLQRFALLKLAREGHDNDNFVPAMEEFGILTQPKGVF
ncbi:nitrate reductase associated protein [Rhizobium sp. A37_96]